MAILLDRMMEIISMGMELGKMLLLLFRMLLGGIPLHTLFNNQPLDLDRQIPTTSLHPSSPGHKFRRPLQLHLRPRTCLNLATLSSHVMSVKWSFPNQTSSIATSRNTPVRTRVRTQHAKKHSPCNQTSTGIAKPSTLLKPMRGFTVRNRGANTPRNLVTSGLPGKIIWIGISERRDGINPCGHRAMILYARCSQAT